MKLGAVASLLLQSTLIVNLLILAESLSGSMGFFDSGDPKIMASDVSRALIVYFIGGLLSLAGLGLNAWTLRRCRPAWFVRWSRFFATLMLLYLPIGTILGIWHLRYIKERNAQLHRKDA